MSDEELLELYEDKKDYGITLSFYECEKWITFEDFIRLMKLKINEKKEN